MNYFPRFTIGDLFIVLMVTIGTLAMCLTSAAEKKQAPDEEPEAAPEPSSYDVLLGHYRKKWRIGSNETEHGAIERDPRAGR